MVMSERAPQQYFTKPFMITAKPLTPEPASTRIYACQRMRATGPKSLTKYWLFPRDDTTTVFKTEMA
jgi:hypothetical protein